MAYFPGRSPFGATTSSSSLVFEEFVPPSAWTEDRMCHYLLVDLPGFKRQELKLQLDNQTHIIVSGERRVRENKYKRFEQSFELPKNSDIENITRKLDGEILYISVLKKVEQEHHEIKHGRSHGAEMDTFDPTPPPQPDVDEDEDEDDNEKKSDVDEDEDDNEEKSDAYKNEDDSHKQDGEKYIDRKKHRDSFDENWGQEVDLFLRLVIKKLKKNKGIVVTAIFAFSLGVLVTRKFQSNEH